MSDTSMFDREVAKVKKAQKSLKQAVIFEILGTSMYLSLFLLQWLPENLLAWRLKMIATVMVAICITIMLVLGLFLILEERKELAQAKAELKARIEWEKYCWSPKGFYELFWGEPWPENQEG